MQQPDKRSAQLFRSEADLADAVADAIAEAAGRLPPAAQSRLLAFLHLMEEPETTIAELEVAPTGVMRLVLTHTGIRSGARSN
jgi:hypothetical protein